MQAVVMAGGVGSRLRPLTIGRPKPLVPLVNQPVIGHIRDLLAHHGVTDIVATVQYMADAIEDYLGDGSEYGCTVRYAVEEIPLGTAGGVKNGSAYLNETFVVISGDALTDFDLQRAFAFHKERGALVTLVLYRVPNPLEYGVVITAPDGRVLRFQEKPSWGEVISDTVNTGIYIIEPEVLDDIPDDRPFDFSKDLFPLLLERGAPIYGIAMDGYWTDIGDLEEYRRACRDILTRKVNLPQPIGLPWRPECPEVWIGGAVDVAGDVQFFGPTYLGDGTTLREGVVIHGPTSIDAFCSLEARAHVDHSILWPHVYVGEGAEVRGALVQRSCNIKHRSVLFEGVVLGDHCVVGEGSVLYPNVVLWPDKDVDAGATVKRSVIWGSKGKRSLFGRHGVTGLVNVDLTPEFVARMGTAFGTTLPKGSRVVINRDPNRSPRMLKRAIISGIPSAGVNAWDTQSVPIPVARHYTRVTEAAGGVHVRLSPFDTRVVDIRFFGSDGLDLPSDRERKIEQAFFREDFRRVYLNDIGTISYAPNVIDRYAADFLAALDLLPVQRRAFRIVVDYANSPTAQVMPFLLDQMGCEVIALNANLDENRMSIPRHQLEDDLLQMAQITGAVGADLGVRFDVGGEKLFVVDDKGRPVPSDRLAAVLADFKWRLKPGSTVAVPANAAGVFDVLAARHAGSLKRTRVELEHLMRAAADDEAQMAVDSTGFVILPALHPVADGMFALARLLEYLALAGDPLSTALDGLPAWHTVQRTVTCPWESKGQVMRHLNEQFPATVGARIDGVRVTVGPDWVLVFPDPDEPVFHVYGDSASSEQAEELASRYARIVETLQG